ncbi:hypothetical protein SAMN05421848_1606 [Kushneria avicenniae]|uniref:Uncharacterized protein n=1 Tax=Kushneria avicenniae TaxID=402385 RepID=A0A1I1JJP9_9GAMM|nr:hypothetical protein [Kushneria avicenniae]SFC48784.1 hypothetical protein SAMN05421848_1606 [Kushneria avicenniae]
MKRFTMKIGNQSIDFTEADMESMDSALTGAINLPGREVVRGGSERFVSVTQHKSNASPGHHAEHPANRHLLTDLHRGPSIETDC